MTKTLTIELPLRDEIDEQKAADIAARARADWLVWGQVAITNYEGATVLNPPQVRFDSPVPTMETADGFRIYGYGPLPYAVGSYIRYLRKKAGLTNTPPDVEAEA